MIFIVITVPSAVLRPVIWNVMMLMWRRYDACTYILLKWRWKLERDTIFILQITCDENITLLTFTKFKTGLPLTKTLSEIIFRLNNQFIVCSLNNIVALVDMVSSWKEDINAER